LGGGANSLTEKLFGDFGRFNDFNDTRVQLFNGGHMVSENTHITRGSSQVDLLNIGGLVDSLDGKKETMYTMSILLLVILVEQNDHYLVG
jgi:hypothetical protein